MHSPTISPTFACNNSTISTSLSPQLIPQENEQSFNFVIQQKKMNTNHLMAIITPNNNNSFTLTLS